MASSFLQTRYYDIVNELTSKKSAFSVRDVDSCQHQCRVEVVRGVCSLLTARGPERKVHLVGETQAFSAIFGFLCKMGFLGHNSGSGHARRSIKGSKDANDRLVSKKIEPKNGSLDWRPGPVKVGQKFKNTPTL